MGGNVKAFPFRTNNAKPCQTSVTRVSISKWMTHAKCASSLHALNLYNVWLPDRKKVMLYRMKFLFWKKDRPEKYPPRCLVIWQVEAGRVAKDMRSRLEMQEYQLLPWKLIDDGNYFSHCSKGSSPLLFVRICMVLTKAPILLLHEGRAQNPILILSQTLFHH